MRCHHCVLHRVLWECGGEEEIRAVQEKGLAESSVVQKLLGLFIVFISGSQRTNWADRTTRTTWPNGTLPLSLWCGNRFPPSFCCVQGPTGLSGAPGIPGREGTKGFRGRAGTPGAPGEAGLQVCVLNRVQGAFHSHPNTIIRVMLETQAQEDPWDH